MTAVKRTMANQRVIRFHLFDLGEKATQIQNGFTGLTNEVGEIADVVKDWVEYRKPLDELSLLSECGDALYRIAQILDAIGLGIGDAMAVNKAKLERRYPEGFTNEAEASRDVKGEQQAVEDFLASEMGAKS